MLVGILFKFYKKLMGKEEGNEPYPYEECRNNSAFVLLHSGIPNEAKKILHKAILSGETASYTASNYAFSIALDGEFEEAEKYISAASFYARTDGELTIIFFNRFLICMLKSETSIALDYLRKSLDLSRDEILKYCNNSSYVMDFIKNNDELKELVANA